MRYSFIFVCQAGALEIKAMLLAASLRDHLQGDHELIAALPTPEERWGRPRPETLLFLEQLGVICKPIANLIDPDYPIGNKVSCLCLDVTGDVAIFIDSDMLCLKPFEHPSAFDALFCAKPADRRTFAKSDTPWELVYSSFGLTMPDERIKATVSGEMMPPYFNAGFIAVHDNVAFGQAWLEVCKAIDANPAIPNKRPWLDQIALPITVARLGIPYAYLEERFNFPCYAKALEADDLPYFAHYHSLDVVLKQQLLCMKIQEIARAHAPLYEALCTHPSWRVVLWPPLYRTIFRIRRKIRRTVKRAALPRAHHPDSEVAGA